MFLAALTPKEARLLKALSKAASAELRADEAVDEMEEDKVAGQR
jgi:hypothetical protein